MESTLRAEGPSPICTLGSVCLRVCARSCRDGPALRGAWCQTLEVTQGQGKGRALTWRVLGLHSSHSGTRQHVLRHCEEVLSLLKDWGRDGALHNADVHPGVGLRLQAPAVLRRDHQLHQGVGFATQGP